MEVLWVNVLWQTITAKSHHRTEPIFEQVVNYQIPIEVVIIGEVGLQFKYMLHPSLLILS